jgi:1-acyl-sn-glycerol-3-phosphate acyltransferase
MVRPSTRMKTRGLSNGVVKARKIAVLPKSASAIAAFGRIYNGYEVSGAENIPSSGSALIVFYHGIVPLDGWYFLADYYLKTGRVIRGLTDRLIFRIPKVREFFESFGIFPGDFEQALKVLRSGQLVAVSPGGMREAFSGRRKDYRLVWGGRQGFAKLAIEAGVPIIPAFTENVRELYRAPLSDFALARALYEMTRIPPALVMGLGVLPFPVKLRTWVGKPIKPRRSETPEQLAARTRKAIEALIRKHQPRNRSVLAALKARFAAPAVSRSSRAGSSAGRA